MDSAHTVASNSRKDLSVKAKPSGRRIRRAPASWKKTRHAKA